ncbi:DNA REPLICATION FACTOR CDT1 [Salix koriyanagi]|uniref:DNA REPLICATION FACTOR CDT1 n=1 Tax=Salix koriyanagi TaxID=2511006 RepID=A0A9Q0UXK9_9ROSI|nr:DNA REPLICATION FACTOR CDT1 [Salix koriyanagi]
MFASQTPAKTNEPFHAKFREGELEILERYNTIVELFDGMNCSLRLLALSKKSPTFQNISAQVEVLTQRKFSYRHLAQIKYLLPEAIQTDKILVHDKEIPMHEARYENWIFASRLVDYFIKHPEACDIPQAILPGPFNHCKEAAFEDKACDNSMAVFCEPFNERSETIAPEPMFADHSREYLPAATESQMLSTPSHLQLSFNRHFSQKTFSEEEKTHLLASPVPSSVSPSGDLHNEHLNEARTGEFPDQPINPEVSADVYTSTSPKCKPDSLVDKLLLETPAQSTPRRAMHSSDDKQRDTTGQKQTLSCKPAKRVLDFSYLDDDKGASEYCEFLHDNSTHPLAGSSSLLKKVEGSLGLSSVDKKAFQSDTVPRQMSIQLPDLVSLVHHIFQSVNFSPITKEELVHKIILDSLDIVDRREVEEQIGILEKQVPDWICRLPAPSGDVLYKIKKMSDLNTVRLMVIA